MPADDRNDVEPIDDYIHQIRDDIKPEASVRNIKLEGPRLATRSTMTCSSGLFTQHGSIAITAFMH